jgi:hypothetical protein
MKSITECSGEGCELVGVARDTHHGVARLHQQFCCCRANAR